MCSYATVWGGRIYFNIVVRGLSGRWKSLESESAMMFLVPLMCWEYMDTLFMTRVHPNHRGNVSWDFSSTGSHESLCIHPRALELSVKYRMWDPCPNCWMFM